jgi:hypothetical protein
MNEVRAACADSVQRKGGKNAKVAHPIFVLPTIKMRVSCAHFVLRLP